jgi:hypothetical protein
VAPLFELRLGARRAIYEKNQSMLTRIAILAVLLTASACRPSESLPGLLETYQELANNHEVEQLLGMFAEGARLDFGPMGTIEGKDRIGAIHDYDRALNTEVLLENCRTHQRSVTCQTIERNDWLQVAGINRIVYSESVFTFDDANRIVSISATLSSESSDSLGRALSSFGAWAQANEAEEYGVLFREDGSFRYSQESGERVMGLLREWRVQLGK